MKRSLCQLVMLPLSIIIFHGPAFGQLSISQVTNKYAPSLVSITAYDENDKILSNGRGFFVNETGDVATNHHVLSGCVKAIVKTLQGETGKITEIIKVDPRRDLIIAGTSLSETIPLLLGDSDKIKAGDDIMIIGHNADEKWAISIGVISGVRNAEGIKLIQITAPIWPGTSGAPVFNGAGKVIGIATAFLDLREKKNFAMPVNYLKTLNPTRLKLRSLTGMTTRLEAVVREDTIIEIHTGDAEAPGTLDEARIEIRESASGDLEGESPDMPIGTVMGIVYFKNGKKFACEKAWKDGNTILLLVNGKRIAVGYNKAEIDMERSFNLSSQE